MSPSWDHREPGRWTSRAAAVLAVVAVALLVVSLLVGTAKAEGDRSRGCCVQSGLGREALRMRSGVAATPSDTYQGRGVRWWAKRAVQARKDANKRGRTIRRLQTVVRSELALPTGHWLDGAFLCLHRFEGSWQDDGLPYFGGLQMDPDFVRAHAPAWVLRAFGSNPARWPAAVQITVGIHAWTTRGFGPWPTRRYCGL